MSFKVEDCIIPKVWCGKGNRPKRNSDTYYYKNGSRYECMRQGFGAGMYSERNKNLSANSLRHIKYVGDVFEQRFRKRGIATTTNLVKKMKEKSTNEIEKFLKRVFTRSNGGLDRRAYNSTILYLYRHGVRKVPKCSKIKVS